ncbi:2-aminobenzoate-CoA ligase [Burkholderia ubonensis]|uniref:AMP-binding protein n=1 Tax=Burkholderia ubonensis TaxID=101571 RepID=UPI000754705A|nr:AMP-binding protein [Burkholderia ubonensis]KVU89818.1 2-aminobenzoate-CoA ligase [Burkholderia ubonensis]
MDDFCRANLPPIEDWPKFVFDLPGLQFPQFLNCAAALLDAAVEERGWGTRVAITTEAGVTWSYRELRDASNRIANMLIHDAGLVAGNRVLLHGANHPLLAAAWFGVVKAGGVVVTTMPKLRAGELSTVLDRARVTHAICEAALSTELDAAMARMQWRGDVRRYETDDVHPRDGWLSGYSDDFTAAGTRADDPCLIAFTSGTTGEPKATVHFHRDVMAACHCFPQHVLKPMADDVFCGSPPLAFTFGLGALLLFPVSVGASVVLLPKASPERLLAAVAKHRVSILFTAPAAYRAMLGHLDNHDVSSLRKCVAAGEALPAWTREAWHERTGLHLIDGIGATEMLHIFASTGDTESKPGAIGKAVPGYRLAIVDEQGRCLPPNQIGYLAVQGPTGCRYLNDARQRDYVRHGWNLTGDAAYLDDEGYLFYQARADDMIISSGYTVSPGEVEQALLRHPDVAECAVVGQIDEWGGTLICAHVVLQPGVDGSEALTTQLQQHVKGVIAPYKCPHRVAYHAGGLPRNESGKLRRAALRQQANGAASLLNHAVQNELAL